jgi:hypothetical protein
MSIWCRAQRPPVRGPHVPAPARAPEQRRPGQPLRPPAAPAAPRGAPAPHPARGCRGAALGGLAVARHSAVLRRRQVNTARVSAAHLDSLRARLRAEQEAVAAAARACSLPAAAAAGMHGWPAGRPGAPALALAERRELLRALAEWVGACEEVARRNDAREAAARCAHAAAAAAARQRTAAALRGAARRHAALAARVAAHNAAAKRVRAAAAAPGGVAGEQRKAQVALELLDESLRELAPPRKPHAGAARLAGIAPCEAGAAGAARRALLSGDCLVRLWRAAAGEALQDARRPAADSAAPGAQGAQGARARGASAPPSARERAGRLALLRAEECHPVPRGVSSSALRGGSGGAPPPYRPDNDRPLGRARPPNASAGRARAYAEAAAALCSSSPATLSKVPRRAREAAAAHARLGARLPRLLPRKRAARALQGQAAAGRRSVGRGGAAGGAQGSAGLRASTPTRVGSGEGLPVVEGLEGTVPPPEPALRSGDA